MSMTATKGNISVQTENIFPIIKKFLYSDQEIFLRELVSNAVDATTKLITLSKRGDVKGEVGNTTIDVKVDKDAKTITISDRGLGMTADEVEKYLNQVAFSGAAEFLEKFKGEANIIGHFGLGFYSAFMVADKVEVVTQSFRENAEAVRWTCDGSTEYTLEPATRAERGTDIILHVSEDANEYLDEQKIEGLLEKYCKFLPVAIQFGTKKEYIKEGEGETETEQEIEVANIINNPAPAWKKQPSELTDEDYKAFYQEIHPYSPEPLFWIHLNIDYPFNLTGILYFPKLNQNNFENRSKIQLYCNQVFVTDNVKDIVPEFLTLLHGVIDSPDIPLNVSRSYLQADKEVKKITTYITRKVADKLQELFRRERESYETKWSDIGVFVKYGTISDEKFGEKGQEFALLKNTDGKLFTIAEYKEHIKANQTDKDGKLMVIYSNDAVANGSLIVAAKEKGYDVVESDVMMDNYFHQYLESKAEVTFTRIDSDTLDELVKKDEKRESLLSETEQNNVKELFEVFTKENIGSAVQLKALSPDEQPVQITRNEFMRRMKEMQQLQGGMGGFGGMDFDAYNVVVNTNHPIVAEKLLKADNPSDTAKYLYDLALLNQGMLKGTALAAFVQKALKMV